MSYTRVNWQDAPSVSTPLSASNLNKMDAGIKQNADDIATLQQHTYDSALDDSSTNAPQTKVVKKAIDDAMESVTIVTDPTLSNEGQAADAKATGDAVAQVKSQLEALNNGKAALYPDTGAWYRGYLTNAGVFSETTTNAAPTNEPFLVTAGHTIDIYPNGLSVTLRKFSKSGNTYTHIASNIYTTDTSVAFDADTYVGIHVNKASGATLTLAEVTTKLWITSNIQYQIDRLDADINDVESSATAQINAVDAKATDGINRLGNFLFEDGDAVAIQSNTNDPILSNVPQGYIHVKSTNDKIYTGPVNFIDLLGLAQGTFTDSDSGVTIEVTGNEVYIHGSPSRGFKFDIQRGQFYTDALTNHPADWSNFPSNESFYRATFWEVSGYTMPTNVYVGVLNDAGTAIQAVALSGHSRAFKRFDSQYFAIYSNGALANLDVKFTIGLSFNKLPPEQGGSAQNIAQTPYGTNIISDAGFYECGALTWTGASNVYDVVKTNFNAEADPLTNGHVYAWFGDSLSQLKELPNIVADLLNVKVYDCTFAGAPLTYGDPSKYQPTGFMSLCSQIVAGDFTPLSDALDAQEAAGTNVTEKRQHLATLEALDFSTVTDIVLLAGTNDFDNDYVNATNFVSGFSGALTTLLTAYPHLMVYVISPPWRGDKTEGVTTIPTMEDIVNLEKGVADNFCLPWYDLYHRSGINALTATEYLTNDLLHPSDAGDALLANKCAKFIQSN